MYPRFEPHFKKHQPIQLAISKIETAPKNDLTKLHTEWGKKGKTTWLNRLYFFSPPATSKNTLALTNNPQLRELNGTSDYKFNAT